jgi:L-ascorbate metabolism protein UlaG (beta-lactamase superfamily)
MTRLTGLRLERALASKQYREGKFHNAAAAGQRPPQMTAKLMREFFFGRKRRVPAGPLPMDRPLEAWAKPISSSGLRITWLGHSTMLIEADGVRVLTDPVFGDRASPLSFAGPKRFHPVPAQLDELPELTAVLLSHNHYDHLCPQSLRALARRGAPIVTSLGVGANLEKLGIPAAQITELDWWEEHTLPGGALRLTATPAQHFSGRGLADRNDTLWSSWVITTERRKLFFSGDTGLTPDFATIAERLGPFEVTMLEIGAWNQAWGDIHLGPENALRAFELLGGGTLMPVHWGTFDLALHRWDEPAETLLALATGSGKRMLTPVLGRPFEPAHIEAPNPWWRAVGEVLEATPAVAH